MITIITKGTPPQKMKALLNEVLIKSKKENIRKYAGILETTTDPLEYQKKMRNEWE